MGALQGGFGGFGVAPVFAPDVDFPRRLKAQIQLLDGAGLRGLARLGRVCGPAAGVFGAVCSGEFLRLRKETAYGNGILRAVLYDLQQGRLDGGARVTSWFRAGSLKLCHHVSRETLPTRGCCGSPASHFSGMFCISGRSKSGPTLHVEHPGTPIRHSATMSGLAMPALSQCDRTREERLSNG